MTSWHCPPRVWEDAETITNRARLHLHTEYPRSFMTGSGLITVSVGQPTAMVIIQGATVKAKTKSTKKDISSEELDKAKERNDSYLKSAFQSIFAKYGHDFGDIGDEIDMTTGEVIVDHGHLSALPVDQANHALWGKSSNTGHNHAAGEAGKTWTRVSYTPDEDKRLLELRRKGLNWSEIERHFPGRIQEGLRKRWDVLAKKLPTLYRKAAPPKQMRQKHGYPSGSNVMSKIQSRSSSKQQPLKASSDQHRMKLQRRHHKMQQSTQLFSLKRFGANADDFGEEEWQNLPIQHHTPVKRRVTASLPGSTRRKSCSSLFAMLGDISDDELG